SAAHNCAAGLHLLKGDWAQARTRLERWIAILRAGNFAYSLPFTVALFAWALAELGEASEALTQVREGEQLLDRHRARGIVGECAWAYHALGRACLLLGRLDEAKVFAGHAVKSSLHEPGYTAYAL